MWNNYCLDKNLVKFSKLEFKQNWVNIKFKMVRRHYNKGYTIKIHPRSKSTRSKSARVKIHPIEIHLSQNQLDQNQPESKSTRSKFTWVKIHWSKSTLFKIHPIKIKPIRRKHLALFISFWIKYHLNKSHKTTKIS